MYYGHDILPVVVVTVFYCYSLYTYDYYYVILVHTSMGLAVDVFNINFITTPCKRLPLLACRVISGSLEVGQSDSALASNVNTSHFFICKLGQV